MKGRLLRREYLHKAQTDDEVSFVVDTFVLGNGKQVNYYLADSPYHVVAVVAVDPSRNVALIRQYRPTVGKTLTEVPSGSPEGNETLVEGARRELAEETGVQAATLEELGTFYASVGITNQQVTIFLATDLTLGEQDLEDTEEIEVEWIALTQAIDLVKQGSILNQISAIALLLAAPRVGI